MKTFKTNYFFVSSSRETRNRDQNILNRKKEISIETNAITWDRNDTKNFPSSIILYTTSKLVALYNSNLATDACHFQNREQMLNIFLPKVEMILNEFFPETKSNE